MALAKGSEIPKDAVALSELEAATYVWNLVYDWDYADTWALRYSPVILGGLNVISGILLNSHYRSKLKLRSYGHFSSFIPITLLPCVFTALFHRKVISTNILLMKQNTCPVCYELKSAVVQCGFGLIYPMVLAPTSAFMLANQYHTYRLPTLKQPKELFQVWKSFTKPLTGTLITLAAVGLLFSSVLTYYEMENHVSLQRKLQEIETRYDMKHAK